MNLQINGHHIEITPAIRDYMQSKLVQVVRHFDKVLGIDVILSVEKIKQKVSITLRVPGKDIHLEEYKEDLYAAIDSACDKLDRQVQKYKEKLTDHRAGGGEK